MPKWGGPNLLRHCGIVLRSLTIQVGVGGEDKRELVTIEALGKSWASAGYKLSHGDLDDPKHQLIDDLWEWHLNDNAPKQISRTGKIALYMPFTTIGLKTRVAALDVDLFRNKDGGKPDIQARKEYLERSRVLHEATGLPFFWAFSRSYGIHHWYFFENTIECAQAYEFLTAIRHKHFEAGLYGSTPRSQLDDVVDPRPKLPRPTDISSGHRLLLPYSGWYPHTTFFTGTDPSVSVPEDFALPLISDIHVPAPASKPSTPSAKAESQQTTPAVEAADIPQLTLRADPRWKRIGTDQDYENRKKIQPFETGVDIEGLIPCAASILANQIEIPDGQWHNFSFLLSQNIAAMAENKETALDQVTEVLNQIGSFGSYPSDSHETFRVTVNSAFRELEKGLPLACRRVQIARDNCCPGACNLVRGGYLRAQGAIVSSQPKVYVREFRDPLSAKVKGERYVLLCIPAFLKPEFQNAEDCNPRDNRDIYFEFDTRETLKYDRFAAAVQSAGMKNIDKYDVRNLLSILPRTKEFAAMMNELIISQAIKVADYTPMFRSEFLRLLGKAIGRKQIVALNHEPAQDHQIRGWTDLEGKRHMAVLYTSVHGIAIELIRRTGNIDAEEVVKFYMEYALPGSKIVVPSDAGIPYIDINFPVNGKDIPLDSGSISLLERSYIRIAQESNVTSMLNRHKRSPA